MEKLAIRYEERKSEDQLENIKVVKKDRKSEPAKGIDITPRSNNIGLLDVGEDTLRHVLTFLNPTDLVRVGTVCRPLRSLSQKATLWESALIQFFDGELPPQLQQEILSDGPWRVLQRQVEFAERLTSRERRHRRFQIAQAGESEEKKRREWQKALDSRVAETRPNYGAIGGQYSITTKCYGQYVKETEVNSIAEREFGKEEATFVTWTRNTSGSQQLQSFNCKFGKIASWKDRKSIDLAASMGADALWKKLKSRRRKAQRKGVYKRTKSARTDFKICQPKRDVVVPPGGEFVAMLKVKAGLYGGCFELREQETSIGSIYSLECKEDGACIDDYSDM